MNILNIDRGGLVPQEYLMSNGKTISYFHDSHIDIVKIDLIFNAGAALQQKKLQAASAVRLITEGTSSMTAKQIADFLDYRGIIVEKGCDEVSSTITAYCHSRVVGELVPMLYEMVVDSVYPEDDFVAYVAKRRQQLQTSMLKSSSVARNVFYEKLFGKDHPLGMYAVPEDYDRLDVADVRSYHDRYLCVDNMTIVLGGNVDDATLRLFDTWFGNAVPRPYSPITIPKAIDPKSGLCSVAVDGAVQNTLRVGRLLPFEWNDINYSRFMILSTLLGGYFGSRLMTNIREDKGYTYGIYAQTRVMRNNIIFAIAADVSADKWYDALREIYKELGRLCDEPVPDDELRLVRNSMMGDFMRSIDGVFERSERYCQMLTSGVTELFTDNFFAVLEEGAVTASELQSLASQLFNPGELLSVSAGNTNDNGSR